MSNGLRTSEPANDSDSTDSEECVKIFNQKIDWPNKASRSIAPFQNSVSCRLRDGAPCRSNDDSLDRGTIVDRINTPTGSISVRIIRGKEMIPMRSGLGWDKHEVDATVS